MISPIQAFDARYAHDNAPQIVGVDGLACEAGDIYCSLDLERLCSVDLERLDLAHDVCQPFPKCRHVGIGRQLQFVHTGVCEGQRCRRLVVGRYDLYAFCLVPSDEGGQPPDRETRSRGDELDETTTLRLRHLLHDRSEPVELWEGSVFGVGCVDPLGQLGQRPFDRPGHFDIQLPGCQELKCFAWKHVLYAIQESASQRRRTSVHLVCDGPTELCIEESREVVGVDVHLATGYDGLNVLVAVGAR
mmetsp:Transcript_65556/g.143072  ORF Transcript_65556/g.143072 Transcript_65556/m.143072 type:complete len:246 (-) Transcript_65556:208-945(-)